MIDSDLMHVLSTTIFHGIRAVHEHSARQVENLGAAMSALYGLKFVCVTNPPSGFPVFMQHEDDPTWRIELVSKDVPAHQAWAVGSSGDYDLATSRLDRSPHFTPVGEVVDNEKTRAALYMFTDGTVIQVLFRHVPVFRDVFARKKVA